ncbi:polygalacturonase PglB [Labrys wisconsinensis]|uniref:Polygalacturonase n=1 Tax=Labrys wisconsinensis TaxID=425677 RepID=A0ABU0J7R1_9HYPH|nr:glycosyl hydrolase family 28 protein [Labrys wisconsinensis]MDQ0469635.1 polygalacturonase [Labrys wisconsinensis]
MILEAADGDATDRLQRAIDRAGALGTRLTLAPGVHETRGLTLRSGTDLHLAAGAILRPAGDYDAYRETCVDIVAEGSDRAMLVARQAESVSISGPGMIEAPGAAFIAGDLADMGTHEPARFRPRVLVFEGCHGVRLSGLVIRQSPMWTLHLAGCSDVRISGMTIDNDRRMPNTDGIVIDSCVDVEIRDAVIATADDGIVLKTSRRANGVPIGPCRDVRVFGCRIESRSCALKIGTETYADIADISFRDCAVVGSNRALGLFSRDGGAISRVAFRRIAVECSETPDGFWGSGEAITVNVLDRVPDRPAGSICDVVFEDISGVMEGAVTLIAERRAGISGAVLRRVALAQRPGALGTGRRYDLRPTRFDVAPPPGAEGRANAYVKDASGEVVGLMPYPGGLPALFSCHVTDLVIDQVRFERPAPLPQGWTPRDMAIVADEPEKP